MLMLMLMLVSLFKYHLTDYYIVNDALDMMTDLAMLQKYLDYFD